MISQEQTESIKDFLRAERFTDDKLIDDLVDHLSCEIESQIEDENISFAEAFEIAKHRILPNEPIRVQKDLEFLTTKTQNIMIKKIAFIGGYVSAICICLSILFFSQSLLGAKRTKLKRSAIEVEHYQANLLNDIVGDRKKAREAMNEYSIQQTIDQANKFEKAELLLIISVIVFGLTYLPYKFYLGYKQSALQLN